MESVALSDYTARALEAPEHHYRPVYPCYAYRTRLLAESLYCCPLDGFAQGAQPKTRSERLWHYQTMHSLVVKPRSMHATSPPRTPQPQ